MNKKDRERINKKFTHPSRLAYYAEFDFNNTAWDFYSGWLDDEFEDAADYLEKCHTAFMDKKDAKEFINELLEIDNE